MIRKKEKNIVSEIIIDLDGPDGNAFVLLGIARNLATQSGYSIEEIQKLIDDMRSGDYEYLLEVLDEHFGAVLIMERS
jgi:hypothetical protein